MFVLIILSISLPLCLVMVVFSCLNCFQRQKFQTFENNQSGRAQNNPSFTVDITDSQGNEHVAIEPLPDILAKATAAAPLRPKIICSERGKQDATLSLVSVQRSFPREQIQYLNEVESGWFGKVLDSEASKIISGCDKSRVMVKMLKDDASKFEQKQFLDEVLAFRCLEHANLLGLLGQCIETTPFLILLEFAPHGNLKTFLIEHRLEVDALIKRNRLHGFAADVAAGVACLHRHGYIHNDLAARNCVIMADYTVKIGDYGISDIVFKEDYMTSGSDLLPIRWMAPEALAQSNGVWTARPGNKASDMWSVAFGVLLWEVFSFGDRPYGALTDEAVLQGVFLDKVLKLAELDSRLNDRDRLWQIIGQCWQEPAQRVEIEHLYQQLDRLISARRDTFEVPMDFEQRWSELPPSKRASSADTELGSRTALAGSFVSSTTTERSSVASINTEAVSEITVSSELPENSSAPYAHAYDGSGDIQEGFTGATETKTSKSGAVGSGDAQNFVSLDVNADVVVEHGNQEAVVTPVKPIAVMSSTPSDQIQSEISEYFSPLTSTPNTLYDTAIEASKTAESGSKDSELVGIDSSFQSIEDEAELTSIKPELDDSNEPQDTSGDFTEFVRTSPTAKSLDFGDFESSHLDAEAEVSEDATLGISSDFSDFKGAREDFSTIGETDKTADQRRQIEAENPVPEKVEGPQSLSLQFDSLNFDSLAEDNLEGKFSPSRVEPEPEDLKPHDILVPGTAQMSESGLEIETVKAPNPGPLLDEDVDQLVQSSNKLELASLGNISVPSLPSEPAQFVLPEAPVVPTPVPAQAMAFTDVPEPRQSLEQSLAALPAQVPAGDALDKSQESLMAVLGESLESQPKSQEFEPNRPEDMVTEAPSDSEKVGTARKFKSETAVHSLRNVEEEKRLTSDLDSDSPLLNGHELTDHLTVCEDRSTFPSQHYECVDVGPLSPDDDVTADSGILSGRQGHFSDSANDDDDDDNDDYDNDEEVAGGSSITGLPRTESPLSAPSPADSDSDVSTSSSTSTSGSSGGEYSCDSGQHTPRPALDTGQRSGPPLDTGQASHRRYGSSAPEKNSGAEEETLEMITDMYLSKGVKSPRVFEMRPLETIPEDQVLASPVLYRDNSTATPSDTSSLEVKYEDLFGTDGFEWDDLCEDSVGDEPRLNS
ncbi:hypothetical protein EGW08_002541, partial [Elysia chlorotica]